jgi:predicted transposase/invertase (TIGR01784 family)
MALSEAYLAWETELKETSREEGLREGLQEGLREGLQEGEERRARAMAITMLQDNLPVEQIVRFTSLTLAQVQQIQLQVERT